MQLSFNEIMVSMHRLLKTPFAKRVLGSSAWSQIIVGGSNFGEVRWRTNNIHEEEDRDHFRCCVSIRLYCCNIRS